MSVLPVPAAPRPPVAPGAGTDESRLRALAVRLEAQFLSEMLRHSGLDETGSDFAGGEGEAQFRSFFREAQAEAMAEAGGIGLAESLFEALKRRADG